MLLNLIQSSATVSSVVFPHNWLGTKVILSESDILPLKLSSCSLEGFGFDSVRFGFG
jgi:hypothetical protein